MHASRRSFWLLLVLCLSLLCLSTKAKLAQYGVPGKHTPQITKATKLAEGRMAAVVATPEVITGAATCSPIIERAGWTEFVPESEIRSSCLALWDPVAFRPPPAAPSV